MVLAIGVFVFFFGKNCDGREIVFFFFLVVVMVVDGGGKEEGR